MIRPVPGIRGAAALGTLALSSGVALTATSGWLIVAASYRPPILTLLAAIVLVRAFGIARPALGGMPSGCAPMTRRWGTSPGRERRPTARSCRFTLRGSVAAPAVTCSPASSTTSTTWPMRRYGSSRWWPWSPPASWPQRWSHSCCGRRPCSSSASSSSPSSWAPPAGGWSLVASAASCAPALTLENQDVYRHPTPRCRGHRRPPTVATLAGGRVGRVASWPAEPARARSAPASCCSHRRASPRPLGSSLPRGSATACPRRSPPSSCCSGRSRRCRRGGAGCGRRTGPRSGRRPSATGTHRSTARGGRSRDPHGGR